jgi:hypothetical protein
MTLFAGTSKDHGKTITQLLHQCLTFWADEGLAERGFNVLSSSNFYDYNGFRTDILSKKSAGVYKFYHDHLIWQSGLTTTHGFVHRPSGIFINNQYYTNNTSDYKIDYENGYLYFLDWPSFKTAHTLNDSPTIQANYWAKEVHVIKNSDITPHPYIEQALGLTERTPEFTNSLPLMLFDIGSTEIEPYELGGTKNSVFDVHCFLFTESFQKAECITDILRGEENTKPPAVIHSGLYNTSGFLAYDTTDAYLSSLSPWYSFYIDKVRTQIYRKSVVVSEIFMRVNVIGYI